MSMVKAPYKMMRTLGGARIQFASPAVGDLDHDPYKEIVVGTNDGWVYAIKPDSNDGTLLWSYQTSNALNAVAHKTSKTTIRGASVIVDLNGDGWNEVVVPVGDVSQSHENGGVVVLTHDGKLADGWPQLTFDKYTDGYTEGIATTPAVADLDGDGKLEIIVGSFDNRVYAWHYDGTWVQGWPQYVFDTVWSSPAVGDLDQDGFPEVVVGVDAHNDPYFGSINGGALYVFHHDGTIAGGFPKYINENFESSPALADLNGDGFLDIIIGGGSYWGGAEGDQVHAWDRFGNDLPGWPVTTGGNVTGAPAVADIDHDGQLEVIVGSWDQKVYAWHHDGRPVAGWPMMPKVWTGGAYTQKSPVIANLDGATNKDGKLEIFIHSGWETVVVDSNGNQLTWDGTPGNPQHRPTYYANYTLDAPPSIADIDGDGKLELVAGGAAPEGVGSNAAVYVWELPNSQSNASFSTMGWPTFKHDVTRSGSLFSVPANDAEIASHTIPDRMLPGQPQEVQVVLRNTGTDTWTTSGAYRLGIINSDLYPSNRIDLPAGTSVLPGTEVTFAFTIVAPATEGYYTLDLRMVQDGGAWFGHRILQRIKVGNQPAFFVLNAADDTNGGGVYAGGLASAISPPSGYTYWDRDPSFKLSHDGAGYFLLDRTGFVMWAGSAEDVGSVSNGTGAEQEIVMGPDGEAYYIMDAYGHLSKSSGAIEINPPPPTFGDPRVRSFAVTPDYSGLYVLDKYGNVYASGTAQPLSPATPVFGDDAAIKIKLTPDGTGYYVLDRYGVVYSGGSAPIIAPNYVPHLGEDWARDFELTDDSMGYYLLDKYGNIYTGGTAVPVTGNTTPTWDTGTAVDLEVADSRAIVAPDLIVSSPDIQLLTAQDGTMPSTQITVQNLGFGEDLFWTTRLQPAVDWLTVSPSSGNTLPATIELSVNRQLSLGTHSTTLVVEAPANAGTPADEVDVSVSIQVVSELHTVYIPVVLR